MAIYKGNTKIIKLYKGTTQIIKRYKGTDLIYSASRLPSEFQEVEYIESSGTQYIDSGLSPTENITFDFKMTSGNGTLFGAEDSSFYGVVLAVSSSTCFFKIWSSSAQVSISGTPSGTIINVNIGINNILLNGNNYSYTRNYNSSINANIYLFARNRDNSVLSYSSVKLTYFKIYDNSILVRNFIPCYRKADNVAGLYDLVNGVFYTNAGTGSFIVGGNV